MTTTSKWFYKYVHLNTHSNGLAEIINFVDQKIPSSIDSVQPMLLGGNEFKFGLEKISRESLMRLLPYLTMVKGKFCTN